MVVVLVDRVKIDMVFVNCGGGSGACLLLFGEHRLSRPESRKYTLESFSSYQTLKATWVIRLNFIFNFDLSFNLPMRSICTYLATWLRIVRPIHWQISCYVLLAVQREGIGLFALGGVFPAGAIDVFSFLADQLLNHG